MGTEMAAKSCISKFLQSVRDVHRNHDENSAAFADIVASTVWRGDKWCIQDPYRWWFRQDGMSIDKIVNMADMLLVIDE